MGASKPTSSPSFTSTSSMMQSAGAGTSLIIFMASSTQTVCPFRTWSPALTKGASPGAGAA